MRIFTISAISTVLVFLNLSQLSAQEIIKTNLSDSVNTEYTESKPMISADGNTLFFARQNSPDNYKGVNDDQDIYISKYGENGWQQSKNIGSPLNNEEPNGIVSMTPTANTLYLLDSYDKDQKSEGLAISHRTDTGWSQPEKVPIQDFHNHSEYVDYFFSTNGKELLLAAERDDSFGDQDLYVSMKNDNGSWSAPINLGDQINTEHPEFSPFLAADNKTLFFASMGHENYGGADIFYTKRLDSTWTNWSEPQNLGPEVNTEEFEAYYSIPANGTIGYYVSAVGGRNGSRDIFSITIPYQFRPDPVILLKGTFLTTNGEQDSINYEVNFLTTSASESEVNIEYERNHFNAILPTGGAYFFYVNKSNSISESHYIDLTNHQEYIVETADIHTIPVEKGQEFTSHNIQFEGSSDEFVMSTYFELVRLLEVFKDYEGLQFELIGHSHDFEDSLKNFDLSRQRLNKIRDFYLEQDFSLEQFVLTPKGDSELNKDDYKKHINSEFEINNRIEFRILDTNWTPQAKTKIASAKSENELLDDSIAIALSTSSSFDIHFGFDQYEIKQNSETLDTLRRIINSLAVDTVKIAGYTCSIGDNEYNKNLSEKRAQSVKNWLTKNGLKANYIDIEGAGEEDPIASNSSVVERKLNRRVEISLSYVLEDDFNVVTH